MSRSGTHLGGRHERQPIRLRERCECLPRELSGGPAPYLPI